MNLASVVGGLAGAGALTLLNQTAKHVDKDAPRLDLLGMNAVAKLMKGASIKPPAAVEKIMPISMAGDLISNSLYFAMAQAPTREKTYLRGAVLGLAAGIGAVALAKPLGIDPQISTQPVKTKALTVAWYVVGGLVAAAAINLITKREVQRSPLKLAKHIANGH